MPACGSSWRCRAAWTRRWRRRCSWTPATTWSACRCSSTTPRRASSASDPAARSTTCTTRAGWRTRSVFPTTSSISSGDSRRSSWRTSSASTRAAARPSRARTATASSSSRRWSSRPSGSMPSCVATGHYARVVRDDGGVYHLFRGADDARTRRISSSRSRRRNWLARCSLSGGMPKDEVRRIALARGLRVADKPDSQEICFVPDGEYAAVVDRRLPADRAGLVVDAQGRVVGRHDGVHHFTVGQRKGLGISSAEPLYVVKLDAERRAGAGGTEGRARPDGLDRVRRELGAGQGARGRIPGPGADSQPSRRRCRTGGADRTRPDGGGVRRPAELPSRPARPPSCSRATRSSAAAGSTEQETAMSSRRRPRAGRGASICPQADSRRSSGHMERASATTA